MLLLAVFRSLGGGKFGPRHRWSSWTDEQLVEHYQRSGEMEAVAVLVDRYIALWASLAGSFLKRPEDIEDYPYKLLDKLSVKLRTASITHFKGWLRQTVRHDLIDWYREQQREKKALDEFQQEESHHPEKLKNTQLDIRLLDEALAALSLEEQKVIRCIYLQEMSYHEIMEAERWTFNRVRGLRDRAMEKLKERLGDSFGDYFKES